MTMLFTKFYEEFLLFKKRWYPNGTKIVPKDIEFTPQTLANWHMGDGEYDPSTGRVAFSVNSFTTSDVEFIVDSLSEILGVSPKIYPVRSQNNQPKIKLSRNDSEIFIVYTHKFKVPCFNYKWRMH